MSDTLFIECKICNKQFKTLDPLGFHLKHTHNITIKEYYDNFFKQPDEGICLACGKETKFRKLTLGYRKYCCKKCSMFNLSERIKNSNLQKYGVTSTMCLKETQNKVQQTLLSHYNVTNPMFSEKVKEKIKNTNLEKYGVENPFQSEKVKEKIKNTNLEKYGVENPFQSEIIKEKIKQTNLEKYGVEYCTQATEIKEKTKQTNLEKYGVISTSQCYEVFKKQKTKYTYNNICFDSSWELAYYIWLTDNNINFTYQPNTNFYYFYKNKKYKYFPDFLINSIYYEIKGSQFLDENNNLKPCFKNDNIEKLKLKQECMIKNNVHLLTYNDILPILKYIKNKYGKTYLKQFKNHT